MSAPAVPLTHRRILVAFSGLAMVLLLAALDSTIVSTALPTIVGELGGLERLAWVVTGYILAQTVVTPIYGKLGDLYGRKRVLQAAIVRQKVIAPKVDGRIKRLDKEQKPKSDCK